MTRICAVLFTFGAVVCDVILLPKTSRVAEYLTEGKRYSPAKTGNVEINQIL